MSATTTGATSHALSRRFSVSHDSDATGPNAGVPYDGADRDNYSLYIDSDQIWRDPILSDAGLDWNENGIPTWWRRHWFERMQDLIDTYEPDMLYSDGALPFEEFGTAIVANLYNISARRNGKVEAAYFSKRPQDGAVGTCVLDRERGVLADISPRPWQTDTCIGDWHYRLGMQYKTPKRIIDILCDCVSRNGNLLLNFPLPASGMLDLEELAILSDLTAWMKVNGEAIFATRPWKVSGEGPTTQSASQFSAKFNEGSRQDLTVEDIRFTTKGETLYAFAMGWPDYSITIRSLGANTALNVGKIQSVELLGGPSLRFEQSNTGLVIYLPHDAPTKHAVAFRIQGAIV